MDKDDCGCRLGAEADREHCRFPAVVAENESLKTERLGIQRALCAEFASPNKDDAEPYTLEEFKGGIRCLGFEREDFLQHLVKARQERDALAGFKTLAENIVANINGDLGKLRHDQLLHKLWTIQAMLQSALQQETQ